MIDFFFAILYNYFGGIMNIEHLHGVGEKTLEVLYKNGIYTILDLVNYYPYRYEILKPDILDPSFNDMTVTINAVVASEVKISFIRKNFNALRFYVLSNGERLNVTIYNRGFLKRNLTLGKEIILTGKYQALKHSFVASQIKFGVLREMSILPVYHSLNGLKKGNISNIIKSALDSYEGYSLLPLLESKYNLISKKEALHGIHFPKCQEDVSKASRTLIYEELFDFMFKIEYLKSLKDNVKGIKKNVSFSDILKFINKLPFKLTSDQLKGVEDCFNDLVSSKKMNRLLLGDVGSGKTIVSLIIMYANYLAGFQGAFLAPTEILATQHYNSFVSLLESEGIHIKLILGSMTKREKDSIYKKVLNGEVDILIGTHAILNDKLHFKNLGFVVTDEQHRFGVSQRELLSEKNYQPDMLFMSATPIPRTYALTIYGDMDTSMIKQKPSGRKDVITSVKKESELKTVLLHVLDELKSNHQVYVVAPMIDEDEESDLQNVNILKNKFDEAFHGLVPIGVLHGKLKKKEKEMVMDDFKNGKTKILISTTVIEVGVDVRDATLMIIFNAERFGLATLHQLRGRVGRSDLQSYCYLICNSDIPRLKVLENSNDGFYISSKDFEFRGEGDLFGKRQSGDMTFKIANLKRDYDILLQVKDDAKKFVLEHEYLKYEKYKEIVNKIDFTN